MSCHVMSDKTCGPCVQRFFSSAQICSMTTVRIRGKFTAQRMPTSWPGGFFFFNQTLTEEFTGNT